MRQPTEPAPPFDPKRATITLALALSLLVAGMGASAVWTRAQGAMEAHIASGSIHPSQAALDARYPQADVVAEQFHSVEVRLAGMERSLARMEQHLGTRPRSARDGDDVH